MKRRNFFRVVLWAGLALALQAPISNVGAAAGDEWIGTWTASPQPVWDPDFLAPVKVPRNLWNQTIRQIAAVSIGGKRVRVVVSNEYGTMPLRIGAAQIALADKGSAIVEGSGKALTFGGRASVVIPPGAPAVSDPVDLSVAPLGSVAVSLFLPDVTPVTTFHWDARQTTYVVAGNEVGANDFKADSTVTSRIFLERDPGGSAGQRACHRHIRRLDHRRRQFDGRRQPSLARRAGAPARGGRRSSSGGPESGHLGRQGAERSNGRQCPGSLRSRRAHSSARRHGDPHDGYQRYRLAGQYSRAER